jgi:arsenate reductase
MTLTKVLFLCTGNSARSQMGEAFLRRYAGDRFDVYSAGLEPQGINPYTQTVMEEVGYDLSDQESTDVTEYLGKTHFGYLITVCAHAEKHCPKTFLGVSERLHWPVPDPASCEGPEEACLQAFRQARDEIDERIKAWLSALDEQPQEEM